MRNYLCDFNDAYIASTGTITATESGNDLDRYGKKVALKNSATFFNCVLKINNQLIENVKDLDTVMPMYNLLYYSKNVRNTTGSFWNYYPNIPSSEYDNNNRDRIFYSIKNSNSFDYKKVTGSLGDNVVINGTTTGSLEDIKIVLPLKNLINFMFNLDFLIINSEIELILKWSEDDVLTGKAIREAIVEGDDPATEPAVNAINKPPDLKFSVTDCKIYVPVITLQTENQDKLYKDRKTGISIDFTWSKYRSQMINQTATNNLNVLIDPTFNNVNRLFALAFPN